MLRCAQRSVEPLRRQDAKFREESKADFYDYFVNAVLKISKSQNQKSEIITNHHHHSNLRSFS
jgi:hypothetical protein